MVKFKVVGSQIWCKIYRFQMFFSSWTFPLLFSWFVVFKPIFASAKMCINPNAELELKTPKAKLHLEVQNIAIEMTKPQVTWDSPVRWGCSKCFLYLVSTLQCLWYFILSTVQVLMCCGLMQYLTMVELLESIDCMVKNAPYRKFRPDVSVRDSAKLWLVEHKVHCSWSGLRILF